MFLSDTSYFFEERGTNRRFGSCDRERFRDGPGWRVCYVATIQAGEFLSRAAARPYATRTDRTPHAHTPVTLSQTCPPRTKPERVKPNWSKQEEPIQSSSSSATSTTAAPSPSQSSSTASPKIRPSPAPLASPPAPPPTTPPASPRSSRAWTPDPCRAVGVEEFGYFFAERVEVLRYLPLEGADEQYVSSRGP